jgi:hypothetical protein
LDVTEASNVLSAPEAAAIATLTTPRPGLRACSRRRAGKGGSSRSGRLHVVARVLSASSGRERSNPLLIDNVKIIMNLRRRDVE